MKTEREVKVMVRSLEKRLNNQEKGNLNSTKIYLLTERLKALNWVLGEGFQG